MHRSGAPGRRTSGSAIARPLRGSSAPFAAGVHLPWAEVPPAVHQWAAALSGVEPDVVYDLSGGFSPGAVARLGFPGRSDIFFKAVGAELNPDSPGMHRREAVISGFLPPSPHLPRLIDVYDDGQWVALAFKAIEGRLLRHPWLEAELVLAMDALERVQERLTPTPSPAIEAACDHLVTEFVGWQRLADMANPPPNLDGWSRRHLDRLADLESGWTVASSGETLLHGDVRSDNMLIGEGGVVLVDWPHAVVGNPVLDLIGWAPSVTLEGGPEPEELMARHGPSRAAEPEVVTALLAAVAGFLTEHSLRPPPPGLPTLRAFQGAQAQVARSWLQRRTGLD